MSSSMDGYLFRSTAFLDSDDNGVSADPAPQGLAPAHNRPTTIDLTAIYGVAVELSQSGPRSNPKAAAQLFRAMGDLGDAAAQYRYGLAAEHGLGVEQNLNQAESWYRKAALQGYPRAMHNLAAVLTKPGRHGKPRYSEAVDWFVKAAQQNIRDSQYNLGVIYSHGLGIPRDARQAYYWFSIAALSGDAEAATKRKALENTLSAKELAELSAKIFQWKTTQAAINAPPAPAQMM